ncbi:putative bifunctional diguanylate cyclase/phosphodiesterase [Thiomicrorhabdus chilensis]|uniref:putative bifunctional diguanylate cyclase/phosphodiesterase n=1 Tax=Thiomicrorhabdus chilensis TaxID=63656 RepID=UPI0003F6666D|nr:EAL domain-containing protein [Thiomicrorhabdus chilensis]
MLSIHRFVIAALVFIILVFYSVFAYYYLNDQQQKTNLIIENIRHDLSETAYIISTEMRTIESVKSFKSFLHRKVANNPLIRAMAVSYGNHILLSTDTSLSKPPPDKITLSNLQNISAQQLMNSQIFETKIRFFIQDQPAQFELFIYLDKNHVSNYFAENQLNFLLVFGLTPLLVFLLLWLALRKYITHPLEHLRQYAYYQSETPQHFKIRELEYVRSSMVQTFDRLEHERDELYRLARTDNLSGLANRNQLNERLGWLIDEASRNKTEFALLFVDLDNFKTVNDTLGHDIGDELLKNISGILQEVLRKYDIIARVGGDEFVIVLSHYKSMVELSHIIQRVLEHITSVHLVESHPIKISASAGVVFYPKDGVDITSLMKNADIAMYEAKSAGKNQFKFFTEALQQQVIQDIELEQNMRRALKNGEFRLYYQPKISTRTGEVIGAEALVRWIDPHKGLIPPDEFIPAAEKNGLMVDLGDWILQEAVRQQTAWKEAGIIDLKISVNLSPVQFLDTHFENKFQSLISSARIKPNKLDIEMTESVFMEDSPQNLRLLNKIRNYGVSISLDDFGKGYSSLAYLKRFPINTLKIDKSFMDDYDTDSGAIFIETIVKIAKTLDLSVVAEGVENQAQLEYLQSIGCEAYQGFYCAPPLPVESFEHFLQQNTCCVLTPLQ